MKILIVKLDKIGDYVLFRNFLKPLREKYKNAEIILLGNKTYKNIVDTRDKEYIDKFIGIQQGSENNLLKELYKEEYDIILHPTYSRTLSIDMFIDSLNAKEKITFKGNEANQGKKIKETSDDFYTRLIKVNNSQHEFDRYKDFFEQLLGRRLPEINFNIDYKKKKVDDYVLIMPGASSRLRRYSSKKLIKLTNFIDEKYNLPILLCGSNDDKKACLEIMNKSNANIRDCSGEINLNKLIDHIGNAKLVIVGDTCGVHISVATKTPVVCLGTGIFYGRFLPYPEEYNDFRLCLPPLYFKNFHGPINLITTKKIKEKIGELLL